LIISALFWVNLKIGWKTTALSFAQYLALGERTPI